MDQLHRRWFPFDNEGAEGENMKFSLMTYPMMEDVRAGKMNFMEICEMADKVKLHHLDIMEMVIMERTASNFVIRTDPVLLRQI